MQSAVVVLYIAFSPSGKLTVIKCEELKPLDNYGNITDDAAERADFSFNRAADESSVLDESTAASVASRTTVAKGIIPFATQIVNLVFVSHETGFVVIDAGMPLCEERIFAAIANEYGEGARPTAIILTHGHFDHVGSLSALIDRWHVPVYAHESELPYVTGERDYPPANPGVGGGFMATISPLYPREAINLGESVQPLPDNGSVPGLPDWRWLHTPGHTPGHISLFRERDGALIAGDAFTTVKQESLTAVLAQRKEIHGPPAYFTHDWEAAWESVRTLAALKPEWAITGHGVAMSGSELQEGLHHLARHFDTLAIPASSE